jgi:hypothetical protein
VVPVVEACHNGSSHAVVLVDSVSAPLDRKALIFTVVQPAVPISAPMRIVPG